MEEKTYSVEGVVLRSRDYKDTDKIVTLFTRERGKLTALAKGARKPTAGLRGAVQPFSRGLFLLARTRASLDIITQGRQEQGFSLLSGDFAKIAYASYLAELTDAALPEGKPAPGLYPALLAALSLVELAQFPERAARYYELRLLAELGAAPQLTACLRCGRSLQGSRFHLSPDAGGLLCSGCAPPGALLISPGAVLTLQKLAGTELRRLPALSWSKSIGQEMERALFAYLDYYLEYPLKSRSFLTEPGSCSP